MKNKADKLNLNGFKYRPSAMSYLVINILVKYNDLVFNNKYIIMLDLNV